MTQELARYTEPELLRLRDTATRRDFSFLPAGPGISAARIRG